MKAELFIFMFFLPAGFIGLSYAASRLKWPWAPAIFATISLICGPLFIVFIFMSAHYLHIEKIRPAEIVILASFLWAPLGWLFLQCFNRPRSSFHSPVERRRTFRMSVMLLGILAALGLGAFAANWAAESNKRNAARRAYQFAEQARLRSAKADAQRCVAELQQRDPVNDADRDISRGDATPIGITVVPHDPPEASTYYEKGCEKSYEGDYRPTGKWFTRTTYAFSTFTHAKCNARVREYVTRYNLRMIESAPEEIRSFCQSQRLTDDERRSLAMAAVFASKRGQLAYVEGGWVHENLNEVPHLTKSAWLIDAAFGPVLVTASRPSRNVPLCVFGLDCVTVFGFAYLIEKGQQISLKRRWPTFLQVGDGGKSVGQLSCCGPSARTKNSELSISEGYDGKDCRSWHETLIELAPEGPINRGKVYLSKDSPREQGGSNLYGEIENVVSGKSFDVVVPGEDIREHYELRGERFVGPVASKLTC